MQGFAVEPRTTLVEEPVALFLLGASLPGGVLFLSGRKTPL